MRASGMQPFLRLVRVDEAGNRLVSAATLIHAAAQRAPEVVVPASRDGGPVARENREAAAMLADDARWMLAQSVAANLEHGRAAVLPPEKRRRLVTHAHNLGLRPFDANMVIAMVQDHARSGNAALDRDLASRLSLVGDASGAGRGTRIEGGPTWRMLIAAVLLAAAMTAAMIQWVNGG